MKMSHLLADTDEELHEMAEKIGVQKKWHQKAGTPWSHYDICLSKRELAIQNGAIQVTTMALRDLIIRKLRSQKTASDQ